MLRTWSQVVPLCQGFGNNQSNRAQMLCVHVQPVFEFHWTLALQDWRVAVESCASRDSSSFISTEIVPFPGVPWLLSSFHVCNWLMFSITASGRNPILLHPFPPLQIPSLCVFMQFLEPSPDYSRVRTWGPPGLHLTRVLWLLYPRERSHTRGQAQTLCQCTKWLIIKRFWTFDLKGGLNVGS